MRIKLHFPPAGMDTIREMGMRQSNPETLRLVANHPEYGRTVVVRGKSSDVLDGQVFLTLHRKFGAWIEVDSDTTKRRVAAVLETDQTGLDDQIKAPEKRAVGRPQKIDGGRNRTIYLSDRYAEMAEKIGSGNISEGIRIAIESYMGDGHADNT